MSRKSDLKMLSREIEDLYKQVKDLREAESVNHRALTLLQAQREADQIHLDGLIITVAETLAAIVQYKVMPITPAQRTRK